MKNSGGSRISQTAGGGGGVAGGMPLVVSRRKPLLRSATGKFCNKHLVRIIFFKKFFNGADKTTFIFW